MFLRQSTIQTIRFGPFLDFSDGVTEETALTITQALRRLSKDGGDFAQSGETGNSTHDENGWYFDDLTAADTDTVGELILYIQDPANHLPVWHRFYVIEEAIYDGYFGAGATGSLDQVSIAEPTGAPAASATLADKISYLYMVLRNKITVTSTSKAFFDDGGASEFTKALSDDGSTYTEDEAV